MSITYELAKDLCGYAGAVSLSLMTFPQVYYSYAHRTTEGLSPMFMFFQILTSCIFIVYGVLLPSNPIIVANALALCGSSLIVLATRLFRNVPDRDSQ